MNIKIYSKTGDKGMTSLKGGKRVPKYHKRIEANGNVDELISYMGLIRSQDIEESDKEIIIKIQDRLMTYAAIIATDSDSKKPVYPELKEKDIKMLEQEIDRMEKKLPPLKKFILPGGHTTVSFCHIARTVCRKAERKIVELSSEESVPGFLIKYFNRLSDYLFVLARKTAFNLKLIEIQWTTKL
jgi:cob(I)alamin adenosyltransferase